jgi:TrmH family RNA methyltransferase
VVLVRPAEPMNLGAAARAMKNCGLSRLTLVAPETTDWVTARRVAVHSQELLAAPQIVESLAQAVGCAQWVVGTTSRALAGRVPLAPCEVATEAARLDGGVALVFGGEESGLSNDDLLQCHAVSTIPTPRAAGGVAWRDEPAAAAQPSLNLAQAVLVYAYEMFQRSGSTSPPLDPPPRADEGELQQVERAIRDLLVVSGFPDPDRRGHGVRELASTLRRSGLSPSHARLWVAALRGAERRLRREH